ncbi:UNVERIFIED_CONTAM: hypothetical protein PYX00_004916 [Menopon gallinae]|uniref:GTP-binding protein REM 1 n=1 Tax=Menopon gallinae TaxID=328185 RepID=A0AAW2I738_9NEOP
MAENVQFTFCAPKENRRNSAPIIIKSPVADFSQREKHLNFVSLSAKFPESPDESGTPGSIDAKKPKRGLKSPVKSPVYRSPKSPKSPKSPNACNYFKFPPPPKKKIAEKIDEYEVYEGRTAFAPVSPTNVNYVPVSPQGPRSSRTSSRQSSSSASGPRGSVSSTASTAQSEMSSLISSSIDSTGSTSTRCRRSTSDLTDLTEECSTENTSLSRPCSPRSRRGSIKGTGLAYLASRRGSRESIASAVSNEDIAPLNFTATSRSRQRRTSNFLELPVPDHIRPRVCSLPEKPYNPRCGDDLYRLRTFSIAKGAVINCGDSIINRRSRSNTSVNSAGTRSGINSTGERSPFDGSCCGSSYNNVSTSEAEEEEDISKYRVVLLGDSGVGKTALVNQFMTSEYMNTYDASLDDEFGEKTVSVLLDGEESEMIFIDHPAVEMSVENCLATYEPHACVVVYSVVNRGTFQVAEDILNYLWRENYTHDKCVILVGNKADLARARVIPTSEGKSLAASRDSKFIETSSGIQHNVDELLVGILKQSRLKETRDKKLKRRGSKYGQGGGGRLHGSKTSLSLNIARELLQKICMNDSKSKSCENLHVL